MRIFQRILFSLVLWTSLAILGVDTISAQSELGEHDSPTIILNDQHMLLLSQPLSAFPFQLAEIEHILGTPDRTVQLYAGMSYFWDALGIAGYTYEQADMIQQRDIFYREPYWDLVYPDGAIQNFYSGAILAGTDRAITPETDVAFVKKHGYDRQPETGVIHKKVGVFAIFLTFTEDNRIEQVALCDCLSNPLCNTVWNTRK